jgi:hypothetical protein
VLPYNQCNFIPLGGACDDGKASTVNDECRMVDGAPTCQGCTPQGSVVRNGDFNESCPSWRDVGV